VPIWRLVKIQSFIPHWLSWGPLHTQNLGLCKSHRTEVVARIARCELAMSHLELRLVAEIDPKVLPYQPFQFFPFTTPLDIIIEYAIYDHNTSICGDACDQSCALDQDRRHSPFYLFSVQLSFAPLSTNTCHGSDHFQTLATWYIAAVLRHHSGAKH
jgi:hypothetical protein